MKKHFLLGVLALSVFFVSAQNFKLSGHVRSGVSATIDGGKDDSGDDINSFSVKKWLPGDYFGDDELSRIRLDGEIIGEENKYGASARFQYAGEFDKIEFSSKQIIYANAWGKFQDQRLFVSGGRIKDMFFTSTGFEQFTFITKKTGVYAVYSLLPNLKLGGAVVQEYLYSYSNGSKLYPRMDEYDKGTKEFGKNAFIGGINFTKDFFSLRGAVAGAGAGYANANLKFSNGLKFTTEAIYQTQKTRNECRMGKAEIAKMIPAQIVLVENIEYTGIENLLLGIASYQHFKDENYLDSDGSTLNFVSVIPAVKYTFTENFSAGIESTIRFFDSRYKGDTDTYANIIPRVDFEIMKGFTATVYGDISTDTDRRKNSIGAGACMVF
ncbi:hypothetical protein [Treponema sp.]|uniref:hypothetical protein n=1 Tax=Treponema sp. TaxID=166 RepID=UPI003F0051AF